jgi:ABC-type Fe3+ transport system substrate-binding protein
MNVRLSRLSILASALVLGACTGGGGTPSPVPSPRASTPTAAASQVVAATPNASALNALVEAARKEGELWLSAGTTIYGSRDGLNKAFDLFKQHYGLTDIKLQFTTDPTESFNQKLLEEFNAGRSASEDVTSGADSALSSLSSAGALLSIDWLPWAPNIRDPKATLHNGQIVKLFSRAPGITYNAAKVTNPPASMADLLKPEYKGLIGTTSYGGEFDRLSSPEMWGAQRVIDYVKQYSKQIAGFIGCPDFNRITTGEFSIFAFDCGPNVALNMTKVGANGKHVNPSDAAHITFQYVSVMAKAPHPNLAKLWVDYSLSREIQDVIYDGRGDDLAMLPGSKSGQAIQAARDSGVKFVEFDVDVYTAIPNIKDTTTQVVNILAGK